MVTDDTTTKRLRSSKAERLFRKQRGVSSTLTGASSDDAVIPPPSQIDVRDFAPVLVFGADGRAYKRKVGF